jgi:fluoroacetyl-CoA thioesterase
VSLPAVGATAAMAVTVTDEMAARFDDEDVHPVYGTAALVRHLEQVSRRLLVPHLESGEEGVGGAIAVEQLAPVRVGEVVTVSATVTEATPRRLVTAVEARHRDAVVARGTFTQVRVDLAAWRDRAGLPVDPAPAG